MYETGVGCYERCYVTFRKVHYVSFQKWPKKLERMSAYIRDREHTKAKSRIKSRCFRIPEKLQTRLIRIYFRNVCLKNSQSEVISLSFSPSLDISAF